MTIFTRKISLSIPVMLASSAMVANFAAAAEKDALEEIVVTAQKRSERLSDVPLSIVAATADQLANQGIDRAEDLGRIVPSFSYQHNPLDGGPVIAIRGVGTFGASTISPTVTVYVDQVPLPYSTMSPGATLDLERLEVLKGPQGTLFGQNSTGGAINYIAAKPTRDLHAGADLRYGRFDEVDLEGFVSGPLSDTVSARVAGRRESRGDWQISQTRPGDELGKQDSDAARLLVDWKPSDASRFELNLNTWHDKSDSQANQYVRFAPQRSINDTPPGYPESYFALRDLPAAPDDARIADWDANPSQPLQRDQDFYQGSLRADFDLAQTLTLTSISAYSDYSAPSGTDVDGTSFNNIFNAQDTSIDSFSQELRLAGDLWTRTHFTLGVNYQHDTVDLTNFVTYTSSTSGVGPLRYTDFFSSSNEKVDTEAVFAAVDYTLTESLTAQAAARYTTQKRDFHGCLGDGGDGALAAAVDFLRIQSGGVSQPAAPGACVTMDQNLVTLPIVTNSLDENNVSWRVGLSWKPQSETLVYANVTKGYKAGGFQPLPAVGAEQLKPVVQESVLSYEVGIKAALGRAVQIAGAVYYADYRDKQTLGFVELPPFGTVASNVNIPKSNIKGAELEMTALPLAGLRLTVGASYLRSHVDDSFVVSDGFSRPVDIQGESFTNAPELHLVSDAQYEHAVSSNLSAFFGASCTYRSAAQSVYGEDPQFEIPSYALVDLRAGIQTQDEKWRVELWGRNVLDKFYLLDIERGSSDVVERTVGMPATYGISFRARY